MNNPELTEPASERKCIVILATLTVLTLLGVVYCIYGIDQSFRGVGPGDPTPTPTPSGPLPEWLRDEIYSTATTIHLYWTAIPEAGPYELKMRRHPSDETLIRYAFLDRDIRSSSYIVTELAPDTIYDFILTRADWSEHDRQAFNLHVKLRTLPRNP